MSENIRISKIGKIGKIGKISKISKYIYLCLNNSGRFINLGYDCSGNQNTQK